MVVGGIIPEATRGAAGAGRRRVFTPKDFGLTQILHTIVEEIRRAGSVAV